MSGIGGWSKDDFWNALHSGYSKRGYYLYPAMPYSFFTKATREDVDAIYDYLATLPQQIYPVDVNHLNFPFSVRWTMFGWNELYFTPGSYVSDPARNTGWNRGAYLVHGLGHGGACHEPRCALPPVIGAIALGAAFGLLFVLSRDGAGQAVSWPGQWTDRLIRPSRTTAV